MDIDKVIAQLFECKPITEPEVKMLCDKVCKPALHRTAHAKHTTAHSAQTKKGGQPK